MATLLRLRPSLLPFTITTTFCATAVLAAPIYQSWRRPILMDSFASSPSLRSYSNNAKTPVVKNGRWNSAALKQVSAGSIMGLVGGVAVSFFSKPLALLIGLLVIGAQMLESRGIHLIPYETMGKYIKNVNVRSTLQNNVAFKLSFGATFALAAFAQF